MVRDKFEICGLCKRKINLRKDNYVQLTDFKEGEFYMEGFYHKDCYNENLTRAKTMKRNVGQMMSQVKSLIGRHDPDGGQVYEIPNQP